jgi:hypothetical protein
MGQQIRMTVFAVNEVLIIATSVVLRSWLWGRLAHLRFAIVGTART